MSEQKQVLNEAEIIALLERVETTARQEIDHEESDSQALLADLDPALQEEINQALQAQRLLAQLKDVQPPQDLPINTARRARRRRRLQESQSSKSWLDLSLSLAVLVLIVVLLSIVGQQVQDNQRKQQIEKIDPVK